MSPVEEEDGELDEPRGSNEAGFGCHSDLALDGNVGRWVVPYMTVESVCFDTCGQLSISGLKSW